MTQFLGSDNLAELVWCPQTGLNFKFAEEKPCFMLEVGPSDSSKNTQNEEHISSVATCRVIEKVSSCTGSQKSPLNVEPIMQLRPNKHVKLDNVETEKDDFSDPFGENAQVESNGSMESCKSGNFLTKTKRKCSFEQPLIFGSKRIKNQTDGSSFMNWISNTMKGLKKNSGDDPRVGFCGGSRSLYQSKHFGFHNVFQSLFSPETIKRLKAEKCSDGSLGYMKHLSICEQDTKEVPTEVFETVRKLQLSRTDILKWMNSQSSVACLDGFFLRLRVAKWEEGEGGSRYYVACITGSQGESPWKDVKQSIRVKVGDVEFLVQSQHVSNCDFLEDELFAWWQKTSKNGEVPVLTDLKSKLAERKKH